MAAKYAPKEPPSFPFKRQLERLGEAMLPLIIADQPVAAFVGNNGIVIEYHEFSHYRALFGRLAGPQNDCASVPFRRPIGRR